MNPNSPLKCDICCKEFSGTVPAQQHFSSREHIRKVENSKKGPSGFSCQVCHKQCDTLKILQEHMQSPRHLAMEEKHKQLIAQDQLRLGGRGETTSQNGNKGFVFNGQRGYCHVCCIDLTSKQHAESHISGKAHIKRVSISFFGQDHPMPVNQLFLRSATGQNVASSVTRDLFKKEPHTMQTFETFDNNTPKAGKVVTQKQQHEVVECTVCNVTICGTENAKLHFKSEKHKKKMTQSSALTGQFSRSCTLCGVTFTGPESEAAHMVSQKHKKKVAESEKREKGEALPMSCNACQCVFSGQESAEAHFLGKKHKRNMENMNIKQKSALGMRGEINLFKAQSQRDNVSYSELQVLTKCKVTSEDAEPAACGEPDNSDQPGTKAQRINEYSEDILTVKDNAFVRCSERGRDSLQESLDIKYFTSDDDGDDSDDNDDHSEDSLVIKPVDDKDNTTCETLGGSERHGSEQEGNYLSTDLSDLSSIMSELKIKKEICENDQCSVSSNSTDIDSDTVLSSISKSVESVSMVDTEPFHVIRNNLGTMVPLGRGRGIFSMMQQHSLPVKVINRDTVTSNWSGKHKTDSENVETCQKSVWSGTAASPSADLLETTFPSKVYPCYPHTAQLKQPGSEVGAKAELACHLHSHHSLYQPTWSESEMNFQKTEPESVETKTIPVLKLPPGYSNSQQSSPDLFASTQVFLTKPTTTPPPGFASSLSSPALGTFSPGFLDLQRSLATTVSFGEYLPNNSAPPSYQATTVHVTSPLLSPNSGMSAPGLKEYIFDEISGRGKCLICEIDFTSGNHMSQHISGKNHLKAREVRRAAVQGLVNNNLVCTVCSVTFSGPEARQQHMESDKHKQKEWHFCTGRQENEFFCDICKVPCSGPENYQQHLAGTQHQKKRELSSPNIGMTQMVVSGASLFDHTVWYPCKICNCNLNSAEQLRIHEASPAHVAKLQKTQFSGQPVLSPLKIPVPACRQQLVTGSCRADSDINLDNKCGDGVQSPLESFLSEELFPPEFLPCDVRHKEDESEIRMVNTDHQYVSPAGNSGVISTDEKPGSDGEGSGSSRRGQGSDLAWATRNKGNNSNTSKKASSSHDHDDCTLNHNPQGASPKERKPGPTEQNPYAATHKFYCHTCKVPANTKEAYETHLRGKRHMQKVCTMQAPDRIHYLPVSLSAGYLPYTSTQPRNYQVELYRKAMANDTLCFLPTGTGKTLVAVMMISAMLHKYTTKNVLFLVDKVLLVLQQAKYIRKEIGDKGYNRFSSDTCQEVELRAPRIASVCMGQQSTGGIPLWQHDVVVVTAAFCENLLVKGILKWEDFSLVVFDEAHHCEKGHPFNSLLTNYHRQIRELEKRPKVLGLTASPAGKADVQRTVMMLRNLVANMGGVRMNIVEEPRNKQTLSEYQSNAQMTIKTHVDQTSAKEIGFRQELDTYTVHCILKLTEISNIKECVDFCEDLAPKMPEEAIRKMAISFIENYLDEIQSSLYVIEAKDTSTKIELSLLTNHLQSICMAISCQEEGGMLIALQELKDIQKTEFNFDFAQRLGLPVAPLKQILSGHTESLGALNEEGSQAAVDIHVKRLIEELTATDDVHWTTSGKSVSLVLVKQRSTAQQITKVLQNSLRMKHLGLNTTYVVGHGGSGAMDIGMNVKQQKRVLEDIKQFKFQVVIATSVAEEGVDWPECERVISLYPPSTVTALVQMRGRARKKNSKFIVLCSSLEEQAKLQDIMSREQNMIKATEILIEQTRD